MPSIAVNKALTAVKGTTLCPPDACFITEDSPVKFTFTDLPIKRIVPYQKFGSLMTILTVENVAVKPHLPDRVVQTREEIDDCFKYIQDDGPMNPSDALRWALKQQMFGNGESGDGPLVGWNLGWIKDALAAKRDARFLSKEVVDYPLTLIDFARFALTEVILPVLGDSKTKSVIWAGTSGVGKTPDAHDGLGRAC
eukprot:22220-Amphidinium_carterae.1